MKKILAIGLFVAIPCVGQAGTVSGTVSFDPKVESRTLSDPSFWRFAPKDAVSDSDKSALVVLEGKNANTLAAKREGAASMEILGYSFWPHFLVVNSGAVMTLKNRDGHAYACQGSDGAQIFRIEQLKSGNTHEQRFASEALIEMSCHSYPFMKALILVTNSPIWALTDQVGNFIINDVPEGEYRAKAYVQGSWRWKAQLQVPAKGVAQLALGPISPGEVIAKTPDAVGKVQPGNQEMPIQPLVPVPEQKTPPVVPPPKETPPSVGEKSPPDKAPTNPPVIPGEKKPPEKAPDQVKQPVKPPEKKPPKKPVTPEGTPKVKSNEPEIEIEVE